MSFLSVTESLKSIVSKNFKKKSFVCFFAFSPSVASLIGCFFVCFFALSLYYPFDCLIHSLFVWVAACSMYRVGAIRRERIMIIALLPILPKGIVFCTYETFITKLETDNNVIK